ncbi:MAG TPA: response regulator, partial [Isosphaeraceae bacterium]|nr:response regulator [Isosphaeraceae bacterium]
TLASTALGAAAYVEEALRWLPDAREPGFREPILLEDQSGERSATADVGGRRRRILVADDNADMRDYLRRLLAGRYDVECVADGQAAWVAAENEAPDLVLADVMMPGLDGFGLLRQLRANARTREAPVILLSARAGEDSRIEGLEAGADDYLVKPFSARELLARVQSHLELAKLRREAQEVLKESENRVRLAQSVARLGIFEWNIQTGVNTWTPELEAIYGLKPGEFGETQAAWERLVHPNDLPAALAKVEQAIESGQPTEHEWRIVGPGGIVRWVAGRFQCFKDAQGKPLRMSGVNIDITDRKAAEETKERLAAIVESSDDAVISKSMDGVITSWNRAAERLYGYSADEIIGRPISTLIPPDHTDDFPSIMERLRRGERIEHYDTVRVAKDGRRIDVSLTISPLKDALGNVVGASKIARDVSERKRADTALRKHSERARLLSEAAGLLLATSEPDAILKDLLSKIGASLGLDFSPLLAGGRPVGASSLASLSRDHLEPEEVEFLETISHYVTAAYERIGLIKQLREQDRRKDEFLATLAHELRNPLAPIRNGLQLIRLAGQSPALLDQAHPMMERQLQQMVRLVDDLLDVSRINQNKLELRKEWVELAAVILRAVETSRPLIEAASHQLTVSVPPEPVLLDADPVRLAQAISNLLNNAAKYSERGGRIWLTAELANGGRRPAREVLVRVRDTGVGIPPDMLPHIFEMFMQEERSLERSQGGLGIGLTLVQRLIQMHGGRVEARSEGAGKGSEFIVRLPVVIVPNPKGEHDGGGIRESARARVRRRILVVDDNRDSADSLAMMLKLLGDDVVTAHDGLAALERVSTFQPDVALLDLGMPKLNGYDAARLIRQQPCGQGLVLIAMTGWGQDEDIRRSREAGFDFHLVKPIELAALEKLIAGSGSKTA